MGCTNCSSSGGTPEGCRGNGNCGDSGCSKLAVHDWLGQMSLPAGHGQFEYVEIRFKNGRKEFFRNTEALHLNAGDAVAVEAKSGHDIGIISLTGDLVKFQMNKKNVRMVEQDFYKIYRHAEEKDIERWEEAKSLEASTMLKARQLAIELDLSMKISDVEYQGDKSKAIFYYTAENRVDFRELIKAMAQEFSIKIEMKQIGMRQEASRLGGIGSCGRELCCSSWLTDFRSVSTSAARYQQLSLNPDKLAGQCGKLKCCLNYELDNYLHELKKFPETKVSLKTEKGKAFFQKMDIFRAVMWYSYEDNPGKFIELTIDRVKEIIAVNKKGKKVPELLSDVQISEKVREPAFQDVVGQDSLTRFDKKGKGKSSGRSSGRKNRRKKSGNRRNRKPKKD